MLLLFVILLAGLILSFPCTTTVKGEPGITNMMHIYACVIGKGPEQKKAMYYMYYVTTICTTQHGYGIHPPLASYIHTVNCPKILFSLYCFEPQVCPHTNSNSLSTVDGAHVRPGCHCHVHVLEWGSVGMRLDNLEVPEK